MTRVTAVITTFNRAHFVGEAIASVLAQTYPDFELLILNNSSADNTEEVVRSFTDPRIRYVQHEAMPISRQRDLAVEMAKTELLGFLDDDDLWLPNKLAAEVGVFDRHGPKVGMVYGGYQFFNEGVVFAYQHPTQRGDVLQGILEERDNFCASASNPLLRREAILAAGGYGSDKNVGSGEDYYLYLKMARNWTVEFTDEIVVAIRQHNGPRLVGNTGERIRLEEIILSEFSDVMGPPLKARFNKKIGGKWVRMGQPKKGREYLARALWLTPGDIQAWGQYLASFLGPQTYGWLHRRGVEARQRKFLHSGSPS
jgi:glycosyltransferase involved in cell wall biosynthesis